MNQGLVEHRSDGGVDDVRVAGDHSHRAVAAGHLDFDGDDGIGTAGDGVDVKRGYIRVFFSSR